MIRSRSYLKTKIKSQCSKFHSSDCWKKSRKRSIILKRTLRETFACSIIKCKFDQSSTLRHKWTSRFLPRMFIRKTNSICLSHLYSSIFHLLFPSSGYSHNGLTQSTNAHNKICPGKRWDWFSEEELWKRPTDWVVNQSVESLDDIILHYSFLLEAEEEKEEGGGGEEGGGAFFLSESFSSLYIQTDSQ